MNASGTLYHIWSGLLTLAFLYNAVSIWMTVFVEFRRAYFTHWLILNGICDALNLLDLAVQANKAYFDGGILVRDAPLTVRRYILSPSFLFDLIAIVPTDLLLLVWPGLSPIRINRLAKVGRVREFIQLTEHRAPWPLGFRLLRLGTFCYLLFHWNACFYFFLSSHYGYENTTVDSWTFSYQKIPDLIFPLCDPRFDVHRNECLFPEHDWRQRPFHLEELAAHWTRRIDHTRFGNLTKKYAMSFYWSALTLVTLGEQPWPANSVQTVFEIVDTLIGLLVFAAIIGDIGIMVSSAHSAKAKFQEFVDGCKRYMRIRHVNEAVRERVINWIEYQWIWGAQGKEITDETELLALLPPRLAMELAAEAHLPALLGSSLFYLCEKGLLSELAIRLQARQFSPGDIVCRRGEVAKEMFIVKHGRLEIMAGEEENDHHIDDQSSASSSSSATNAGQKGERFFLVEGDLYGDWPLVSETKIPHTIRSSGYSCLYTIGRDSLACAFEEYPHSRRMVRRKANLLRKLHQQGWDGRYHRAKSSPTKSFDSEDFLFSYRHESQTAGGGGGGLAPPSPFDDGTSRRPSAIIDADEAEEEEVRAERDDHQQHSSLENCLRAIQKTVLCITSEVELAERNFVSSSTELKRWLSEVEQEYRHQRPRLKNLLIHRRHRTGPKGKRVKRWLGEGERQQ